MSWNNRCRWPEDNYCRPSRLAEFTNGMGSSEYGSHNNYCDQQVSCSYACRPESPPTHVIYMPICTPRRPRTPPPRNRLASIDILEALMPRRKSGCCCCEVASSPMMIDPCTCTQTRQHRVTCQAPSRRDNQRWPFLPLPKPE